MTTMTITAQPENGALQLAVTTLDTITAVTRSDGNGVGDVRTLPGVLPFTAPRLEDLRNYVQATTTVTGYSASSATINGAVDASYCRATATGSGSLAFLGYDGFASTGVNAGYLLVSPGDQLAANVQLRNKNAVSMQAKISFQFFDAAKVQVGGIVHGTQSTIVVDGVVVFSVTATAPAGAAAVRPVFYLFNANGSNASAGLMLDWKYLATYKGAKAWANVAAFFHGGVVDTAVYDYSWAGTAYASESIRSVAGADLILTDFEAASGDVDYTVTGTTGAPLTGSTTWTLPAPWLFVPVMPSYSVKLKTLLEYSAGGESLGTVHQLLGRDDPVAILRGMSTRAGTLRLYCGTFAEAMAVIQATRRGEVLMLRQPEHAGMDMYFCATSYGVPTLETKGAASVFGVDLGYVELARPDGDLSGSLGWTFASLASSQTTFAKLPKVYATFQDMLLDERI